MSFCANCIKVFSCKAWIVSSFEFGSTGIFSESHGPNQASPGSNQHVSIEKAAPHVSVVVTLPEISVACQFVP